MGADHTLGFASDEQKSHSGELRQRASSTILLISKRIFDWANSGLLRFAFQALLNGMFPVLAAINPRTGAVDHR